MIAKCAIIALLAVAASAACCSNYEEVVMPSSGLSAPSSQVAFVPAASGSSSETITRNLIGKGKYPVALRDCGPSNQQIQVTTSRVTAPTQEKPTIRLPARIPGPKVISHSCTCYKTVVRPRVHQQIITVPTVQRYIETTHKPVVESFQYEATPVNCQSGASSSGFSQVQTVQIPQAVEAPRVQVVEAPRVQVVEAPAVQTVQVPQIQTVQVPQVQTVQVPQVQTVQVPQIQTVEVPQVQTVQVPQVQTVEVPRVEVVEAPQVQTVAVPQVQTVAVPQVQTVVPQFQSYGVQQFQSYGVPQCC